MDPACAKLCSDQSAGVPLYKPPLDAVGTAWLALPPTPPLAMLAAREPAGVCHATRGWWRDPVPIPIAFLRLTL